ICNLPDVPQSWKQELRSDRQFVHKRLLVTFLSLVLYFAPAQCECCFRYCFVRHEFSRLDFVQSVAESGHVPVFFHPLKEKNSYMAITHSKQKFLHHG